MCEERERVRCRSCELVQWSGRSHCRRCGAELPKPIVKIVERVVEKIVIRPDLQSIKNLAQDSQLETEVGPGTHTLPTMAEMERTMILAAYQRSNRRPLEAARLLGIGKTTLYRKLREMRLTAD